MHINEFFSWGGQVSRFGRHPSLDGIWLHDDKGLDGNLAPLSTDNSGKLDADDFAHVVAAAPLVAIDLIVEDLQGNVLLGLRRNPPAQDFWFVPGGRIRKGETLDTAFLRISCDELGHGFDRSQAGFVGVYEHFYDTNFRGTVGASTHYIVHAYRLQVERSALQLPAQQHSQYTWMSQRTAKQHPGVHPYTQAYLQD